MSKPENTAREIAEDLLARSGHGLITGDFDVFCECFALPTAMETFEGRRVINTRDELKTAYNTVCAYYEKVGTTELVRHIVDAEFRNPTSIVSTHQAKIVADAELVQQPYDVLSVIELIDGAWRIRHSEYAIVDSEEHNTALTGLNAVLEDNRDD